MFYMNADGIRRSMDDFALKDRVAEAGRKSAGEAFKRALEAAKGLTSDIGINPGHNLCVMPFFGREFELELEVFLCRLSRRSFAVNVLLVGEEGSVFSSNPRPLNRQRANFMEEVQMSLSKYCSEKIWRGAS